MIIGKAGTFIREIKEACGVQIQIFPRQNTAEAVHNTERVITIAGGQDDVGKAVEMALSKVAADPNQSAYANIQYSNVQSATGGPQMAMGMSQLMGGLSSDSGSMAAHSLGLGLRGMADYGQPPLIDSFAFDYPHSQAALSREALALSRSRPLAAAHQLQALQQPPSSQPHSLFGKLSSAVCV